VAVVTLAVLNINKPAKPISTITETSKSTNDIQKQESPSNTEIANPIATSEKSLEIKTNKMNITLVPLRIDLNYLMSNFDPLTILFYASPAISKQIYELLPDRIYITQMQYNDTLQSDITDEERDKLLVEEIKKLFGTNFNTSLSSYHNNSEDILLTNIDKIELKIQKKKRTTSNIILAYLDAKRTDTIQAVQGPKQLKLSKEYRLDQQANNVFLQYLVNLRMNLLDANYENNKTQEQTIQNWFNTFENLLKQLFNDDTLKLKYNNTNFNFDIINF